MSQPPDCFGKLWDSTESACAGGYDPAYVSPSGSKSRPKCDYYDSCKTRTMLAKVNQQPVQPLVAPQSLVRPPMGPYAPQPFKPAAQPTQTYTFPHPHQQHPQQYAHTVPGQPYPMVVTQPIQMMPTNYGMPAYLTSPEMRRPNESALAPLGREVLRSMGKAFGHSIAHFFDVVSFSKEDE